MRLFRLVLRLLVIVEVADNLLGLSPGLYAHNYTFSIDHVDTATI